MIRALSTAATGMEAQQTRLDVTANNLANVSTAGFKRGRAEFEDLLYQTTRPPGAATGAQTRTPTGLQVGLGVRTVAVARQHEQGPMKQTGSFYDVAIQGEGFLRVQLAGGDIGYTRNGELARDAEGRLVTADGLPLADEVTIPPDAQQVSISADGAVTAVVPGNPTPVEVGRILLTGFANPAGLTALGRNLLRESAASGTPVEGNPGENGLGSLMQGSLELSNVKVVEEMIDLVAGQRAYEVNARVVKAADEMLAETTRLR